MVRSDRVHDPGARAHRFSFLADGIDQDELAFLVVPSDAVDDQLVRAVKRDPDDIVGVRLAGEKAGHVELRTRVGGCRGNSHRDQQHCRRDKLHWRPATRASTTVGSASVEISPRFDVWPSAILRRIRRMILPERVFGSAGVKWIFSGAASAPMSWRTSWFSSLRSASLPSSPAFRVTNA